MEQHRLSGPTATQWAMAGHGLATIAFLAGVGAWTAWTAEIRTPLALIAAAAQLGSMACYMLGHRRRMQGSINEASEGNPTVKAREAREAGAAHGSPAAK